MDAYDRCTNLGKKIVPILLPSVIRAEKFSDHLLAVWLGFYTRNYEQINLLREKNGRSVSLFCSRGWYAGTVSSLIMFIHIHVSFEGARERHSFVIKKVPNESQ